MTPKGKAKERYVSKWVGGIFHIYDFVYCQNYYFMLARNEFEYRERINKALQGIEFKGDCDSNKSGGFHVYKQNETPVCFLWAYDKRDVIHECFHAVYWVLKTRGMPLRDENEETYAYLLSFLVKEILNGIKLKKG